MRAENNRSTEERKKTEVKFIFSLVLLPVSSTSEDVDLTGLPPAYTSDLQTWQILKITCVPEETLGMWLFGEPLIINEFINKHCAICQPASWSQRIWQDQTSSPGEESVHLFIFLNAISHLDDFQFVGNKAA